MSRYEGLQINARSRAAARFARIVGFQKSLRESHLALNYGILNYESTQLQISDDLIGKVIWDMDARYTLNKMDRSFGYKPRNRLRTRNTWMKRFADIAAGLIEAKPEIWFYNQAQTITFNYLDESVIRTGM